MPKFIDLTGEKFGKLTVIKRVENSKSNEVQWLCSCQCGEKPIVKSKGLKRRERPTRSCGCLNKEGNSAKSRNIGERKRALFRREKLKDLYPKEWNELPTTRNEAINSTIYSTTYFNATFCKYNHLERQYTATGRCVACAQKDQKAKDKSIRENRAKEIFEKKEFRLCPECSEPFLMIPEYRKDKRFCSKKCAGAEAKRNYVIENPEKKRASANAYTARIIEENGDQYKKAKKRSVLLHLKRYKNDPAYKLRYLYQSRLRNALKYQQQGKSYPSLEYLGCEVDDFAKFIEKQFDNGMNWENHKLDGWHLDHVRPCESFDFKDINQALLCFNWRNYQPLWWDKNIGKADNYDIEDEEIWIKRMINLGYSSYLYPLFKV